MVGKLTTGFAQGRLSGALSSEEREELYLWGTPSDSRQGLNPSALPTVRFLVATTLRRPAGHAFEGFPQA